jgi:hypothetical protein
MVIGSDGNLVASLDDREQAMLVFDLERGQTRKLPLDIP